MQFYQPRSNAITLFNSLPAICIEKVVFMKTGEDLYSNVFQSPRLPRRTILTTNLHHGRRILPNLKREHPTTIKANEARGPRRLVARSLRTLEAVTQTSESKVYDTRQSRKKTYDRREMDKKLIHQFDTHPNRDSLMEDLNKTEEFNQFSERSKELISSMGHTEYFELCAISSNIQCPDCSLNWDVGIVYCTLGKCLQPSERNRQLNEGWIRRLVNPRLRH